jgi:hypothetical protein
MRSSDATSAAPKIQVMSRLVREIGNEVQFVGVGARTPAPEAMDALRSADVIVGCVDNLHARADLVDVAWRNIIPYVDVGVSIRALTGTASAPRVSIGGNVFVFIPGGFCPWCCGFLSDEKLRAELGGREARSYFAAKSEQAQVVSFNATVAGQAVSEVLQLLCAYRGSSLDPASLTTVDGQQRGALKFDGLRGTLEDWGASRNRDCAHCGKALGAGMLTWRRGCVAV